MNEMEPELGYHEMTQPEMIQYMEDRANRTFYLDSYIDENFLCMEIAKNIISLNMRENDDRNPIKLYIYSYGGDLAQALMLCDVIATSRILVYTIAMGPVMSAGCIVFLAGHKRFAYPHANLMLHYGRYQCDMEEITEERRESAKRNYQESMKKMKNYILERTNMPENVLEEKLNKTWYISKEEMLSYGIVHDIIGNTISSDQFYAKYSKNI